MSRTACLSLALTVCCIIVCITVDGVVGRLVEGANQRVRIEYEAQARSIAEQLRMQLQAAVDATAEPEPEGRTGAQ